MKFMYRFLTIVVLAVFSLGSIGAFAEYPTKPVTMIVPYGPGGAADLAATNIRLIP